ncbi:DUF3089 domain-containing protein [Rhizorhabdus dicambivorans]|uniref:DUF3089 domain-containing protein n=1 Tax=Rhizorhabdus dicambivorans TaxID=1850238 RepID=A0A2A4G2Q2_9SPHN|nr:DUF3089 domain-containing protein [Rhizorhabdus dicambivorans]ATE65032.1 DUF3089 domain-containing protein [Rhizorhabdus dicambivorans]PCE44306.1 DUF3089 domain-containing protein [Rhizorhabdus dicambivorans]
MLARRFLYIIAGLIVLTLAAGIGWNLFQDQLVRLAFVPSVRFDPNGAGPPPDYGRPGSWLSRPDLPDDPARWLPAGEKPSAAKREIAVFYVPPTTYYGRASWNTALDDAESRKWLRVFGWSEASAFNRTGAVWAPRYRSAALGAFLSQGSDAPKALDLAYGDVARAFDAFLAQIPASRPILLAGHSQGTLHLMRLMQEKIAGKPLAQRIVASYLVGWPISTTADIPALGLPACGDPRQANCILSWQSFAEPAEPRTIREIYDASAGLTGAPRRGTPMLCVNPLTGAPATAALPAANLGALMPTSDFMGAELKPGVIAARCDPSGLLMIGRPPRGFDRFVMPGNNYHVFDYALFWGNIRADAEARAKAFLNK